MTDYEGLEQGEIYLSSLTEYGRNTKTILLNFISEASKKADITNQIYRDVLEALLLKFQDLSYRVSPGKFNKVKCFHSNAERTISKLNQDNSINLPISTINNIGSADDKNRLRYKGTLTHTKIWDTKKVKARRVVSIAPKPVNITYELAIWSKYVSDIDEVTSQIRREFNPHSTISISQNKYTKVFLDDQYHTSNLNLEDREDRLIRRTFNVTVQTYINYPEYLLSDNSKIQLMTTELYEIIQGPITKITDGDVKILNPDAGARPPDSTISTGVQGLDNLYVFGVEPEFGPYYLPRTINIDGQGFLPNTQVRVGTTGATSVTYIDDRNLQAVIPAFDLSAQGEYFNVTLENTVTNNQFTIEDAFLVSPIPVITAIDTRTLDNGSFDNSSLAITVSGEYFDSFLEPYYTGANTKSVVLLDGVEYPTDIVSDIKLNMEIDLTPANGGDSLTLQVRNYSGSATHGSEIVLPEVGFNNPGGIFAINSVNPSFGPYASGVSIDVSGTGFESNGMSATLGGEPVTIVDVYSSQHLKLQLSAYDEALAGSSLDLRLELSDNDVVVEADAYEISPEPYLGETLTTSPTFNGTQLQTIDLVIDGSSITSNIDPFYTNANTTKVYASSTEYGNVVQLSALTLTDTSISGTLPIISEMENKFFSLTVSNINGAGESEALFFTSTVAPKTTEIAYEETSAISNMLTQTVVPIEPVSTVPRLWIDGEEADVFPVSREHRSYIDVVQVVGPTSGGGTATLSNQGSNLLPSSVQFNTLELSGIKFVMDVVGKGELMTADLFTASNENEVFRNGKRLKETMYHDLIKDSTVDASSSEYTCGNVQSFVTRRSDTSGIDIWLLISNDNYDLNKDPRTDSDTHLEIAGDVWFNSMQLSSLPSGYRLYSEFDDGSMNTSAGWVVSAVDDGDGGTLEQVFPARQRMIRHYVLGPDTAEGQAEADFLFTMGDYGVVREGIFSYYETSGYGAQRDFLPPITNDCQKVASPVYDGSGWEVMDYRCSTTFQGIKDAYANSTSEPKLYVYRNWGQSITNVGLTTSSMINGYYQPYDHPNSRQGGGFLIHTRHGWQNSRWIWRTSQIQMTYQVQRHDSSLTDLSGNIVTPLAFATSNPDSTVDQLYSPWSFPINQDQPQFQMPWFVGESTDANQLDRTAKPTDRVWNNPTNTSATLYFDEDPAVAFTSLRCITNFNEGAPFSEFGPYEGSHSARYDQTFQPLIWSCNLGIAKHIINQEGSHFEHATGRFPVKNSVYNGNANGPNDFMSNTFSIYEITQDLKANNEIQWGRRKGAQYPNIGRMWGHPMNIIAESMRIASFDRRAELFSWAVTFTNMYVNYASNVGTITGKGAGYAQQEAFYGTTDIANASGASPASYEGQQLFLTAFASHGLLGILQAFFGTDGLNPVANFFRKTLVVLPYYLWKHADDIGNEYAQNFLLLSNTTSGSQAPPPTTIVGWDFNSGYTGGYYSPVAEMKCVNLLYSGFLLTGDIKFVEWFYVLMTEFFMTDGEVNLSKGFAGFSGGVLTQLGVKRPTNVEEATKLFNQVAGQAYAGTNYNYGWETQSIWANHAAQFIGLLQHKTPEVKPAPEIPSSIYGA